ncbi:ABC transporter substrate-binding protein [Blastococcus sp. SYSU D00695]
MPRRTHLLVPLSVLALLAACGSDPDREETATPDAGGEFPVTVEHAFGETTVPAEPQRVVSVGFTEQDTLLALGVVPVGVTEWFGDQPHAVWPWAQDELGDAEPAVLDASDGINVEAVAALEPDLIIGTNAGLDEDTYRALSGIAPTIAHSGRYEDHFEPWDVQADLIGTAVGRRDEARDLTEDLQARFADTAATHPEFAGTAAVFLQNAVYDGSFIAYQDGLSTEFLTDLGFVVPPSIAQYAGEGQAYIPLERAGVLNDAEVLLWATEAPGDRAALEEQAVYRALEPVQAGRLAFTDQVLAGAIYFTSPLSLPYVLDELVPRLEAAVAGDPSTVPAG